MNSTSRRRALQAAAKVAFSYALIGAGACGGATTDVSGSNGTGPIGADTDPSGDGPAASGESEDPLHIRDGGRSTRDARVADATRDVTADAAMCTIATDDAGAATEGTRACCANWLGATATHDAGWDSVAFDKTGPEAANIRTCCHAIVDDHWSHFQSVTTAEQKAFQECCNTFAGEQEFMTCTPWGPPMPPRFLREVA